MTTTTTSQQNKDSKRPRHPTMINDGGVLDEQMEAIVLPQF
jgi:hypothetical protein